MFIKVIGYIYTFPELNSLVAVVAIAKKFSVPSRGAIIMVIIMCWEGACSFPFFLE